VRDETATGVVVSRRHETEGRRAEPHPTRAVALTATRWPRSPGGFKMTALPPQGGADAPAGIAYGKFHGATTRTVPIGVESTKSEATSRRTLRSQFLRSLRIGLGFGLAGVARITAVVSILSFSITVALAKRILRRSSIERSPTILGPAPRTARRRRRVQRRRRSIDTTPRHWCSVPSDFTLRRDDFLSADDQWDLSIRRTRIVAKALVIASKASVDVGSKFATLAKPVE